MATKTDKSASARFRDLVASCGAPEAVTLWGDPKKDEGLQAALRKKRVLSIHEKVGTADWGEVGLTTGKHLRVLIFPASLEAFAGRRIVEIDPRLLSPVESANAAKPAAKPAARKSKAAAKLTAAKPVRRPKINPAMRAAIDAAKKGLSEGGIPIGAALAREGKLIATGHNKRVQDGDPVTHGETDCLRNAGRIGSYRGCTLYSTLMPCYFCAGAAVQFGIKKVVVGESRTFPGAPEFMRSHGIEVVDLDLPECYEMMAKFIEENPKLWNEDIGED